MEKKLESFIKYANFELLTPPQPLNYEDYSKKEAVKIKQALSIWKYLRDFQKQRDDLSPKEKTDFILALLKEKMCLENSLIKVVVMVESLPTTVWRELLWRENIDFMSFESFLRRLDENQIQAIEDNFSDFHGRKRLPRVMKKSLRKRVRIFFNNISFKKLEAEEYDYERRHKTRNAWAYNLLGLDFGFSLYPKGENNDKKITNKSFTRFLSIKEHINDFVVNQEDGKYWWMYKKARTNYAFFPKKQVEMRTHVCPGFWYTMFMHLWFWIISPIALLTTAVNVWQFGLSWANLSPLILAIPILVWLLIAGSRLFWQSISAFFSASNNLVRKVKGDSWWLKGLKLIGRSILVFLKFVLLLVILIVLINASINFFNFFLPILGRLLSVFLYLSILYLLALAYYLVIVWYIPSLKDKEFSYETTTKPLKYFFGATLFASVVVVLDKFVSQYIFSFIANLFSTIWVWFSANFLVAIWMLILISFFSFSIYLLNTFEKNERKFVKYSKYINLLAIMFVLTNIAFILLYMAVYGYFSIYVIGYLGLFLLSFSIIAIGIILFTKEIVNSDNIYYREKARYMMDYEFGNVEKKYVTRLISNKDFKRLLKDENRFLSVRNFLNVYFNSYSRRFIFLKAILSLPNERIDKLLDKRQELFDECMFMSELDRYKLLQYVVFDKLSVSKALEFIEEQKNLALSKSIKKKEKLVELKRKFIYPFTWIWRRVYRFFATLKDLWDFFNKRCPYISRSKVLY